MKLENGTQTKLFGTEPGWSQEELIFGNAKDHSVIDFVQHTSLLSRSVVPDCDSSTLFVRNYRGEWHVLSGSTKLSNIVGKMEFLVRRYFHSADEVVTAEMLYDEEDASIDEPETSITLPEGLHFYELEDVDDSRPGKHRSDAWTAINLFGSGAAIDGPLLPFDPSEWQTPLWDAGCRNPYDMRCYEELEPTPKKCRR